MQNCQNLNIKHDGAIKLAKRCKKNDLRFHVQRCMRDDLQRVSDGLKAWFWLLLLHRISGKGVVLRSCFENASKQEFDLSLFTLFFNSELALSAALCARSCYSWLIQVLQNVFRSKLGPLSICIEDGRFDFDHHYQTSQNSSNLIFYA